MTPTNFDTQKPDTHSDKSKASEAHGFVAPPPGLFVRRTIKSDEALESIQRPSVSYWQDAWMRIRKNRLAMVSGSFILIMLISAAVVPELLPYKYDEQEVWNKHAKPSFTGVPAVVVAQDGVQYQALTVDPQTLIADPTLAPDPTLPPEAPTTVELIGTSLTTAVAFQWSPVPGADGYRIYRSIAADTLGVPLQDLSATQVSFQDRTSLQAGTRYHYAVLAFNPMGDSIPSPLLSVTPKLSLSLEDAKRLDASAVVGGEVMTHPHYLGTDYLGRDLLARIMAGARVSLGIGLLAPLIYILIGIVYGCISGYMGGTIDNIMMRFADIVSTVPYLLIVIMVQVFLGSGPTTLILALVIASWATSAQQVRGEVLRMRESEFVHAAQVLGTRFHKIIFRHLLPNVMGTVLVLLTLSIPQAMFAEAFLSFIGLGIAPPMPSWGSVTREGAKVFLTYPHQLVIPAIVMSVTMLAFNIFGDGLRDCLDPKLRGAR